MFKASIVVIIDFMRQLDWARDVQTTSKLLFLGESVKVFLEEDLQGSGSSLCDTPVVDTHRYTFVRPTECTPPGVDSDVNC